MFVSCLTELVFMKSQTRLRVVRTSEFLHLRPAEIYLGSFTWRGSLTFFYFADGNVYEEGAVKEWVEDVANAAVAYLGSGVMVSSPASSKL